MLKFVIIAVISILSTNCFARAQTSPLKLALNWKAEPQFGGFYTAEQQGIFKKNNLDIEILQGGSGTPTIQMLASGQVDIAIVSADEIILAHDRGAKDVVALFAVYQTNPQAIMSHEESGFKNLADVLKSNGTLLWQSGLPYAQFLQKKYAPISIKSAPYSGGIGVFQHDKNISQQCFYTSEPLAAEKAKVKIKTFLVAESGYNPYTTVVAVKKSFADKEPELVKNLKNSLRESWSLYLKNPTDTNKYMAQLNKAMDLETFEKSAQVQTKLIETSETKKNGLGSMTSARWTELYNQMSDLKLIKSKLSAEDFFLK